MPKRVCVKWQKLDTILIAQLNRARPAMRGRQAHFATYNISRIIEVSPFKEISA